MTAVFGVEGHNGSIQLHEDRVCIKHSGVFGFLTQGFSGTKEILLENITSVDFREPTIFAAGFLRVLFPGAEHASGGAEGLARDENTVLFRGGHSEQFRKMKALIDEKVKAIRVSRSQSAVAQQASSADELMKFASLMEKGIITREEFEAKKKQLLGL